MSARTTTVKMTIALALAVAMSLPSRDPRPASAQRPIPPQAAAGEAAVDAAAGASVEEATPFGAWFHAQGPAPATLPPDVLAVAARFRYVFVAGFFNEAYKIGYFRDNKQTLLDAGVRPDAIHLVFPRSGSGVEENVAVLGKTIPALAAKGPQKLVLIGHSKGAAELLAFALSAPDFVRERVEAIFLVQGALGGSGVADSITGHGHPLDSRMPVARRAEFAIAAGGGKLLDLRIDRGFQSLTHARAAALWARLIPRDGSGPDAPARLPAGLGERIFYTCSARAPSRVASLLTITANYLATYYSENDGLVERKDQQIPGVGTVLATLDADHMALVLARPVSDQRPGVRRAFTQALLMQLAGAFPRTSASAPPADQPSRTTSRAGLSSRSP